MANRTGSNFSSFLLTKQMILICRGDENNNSRSESNTFLQSVPEILTGEPQNADGLEDDSPFEGIIYNDKFLDTIMTAEHPKRFKRECIFHYRQ